MIQIIRLILFFIFFIPTLIKAQEDVLVDKLYEKINNSKGLEKLTYLDSLAMVVNLDKEKKYDSIAEETIQLALELEEYKIASNTICDLIAFTDIYLAKPEEAIQIYKNYLHLAPKFADDDRSRFYLNASNVYQYQSNYEVAKPLLDSVLRYALKANNQRLIGFANLYKGQINSSEGNYAKASQLLKISDEIFTEDRDTFYMLSVRNTLSVLYSQNDFFDEAENLRSTMIPLAEKRKEYGFLSSLYANKATDLEKQGKFSESIKAQKKALDFIDETDYVNSYKAGYVSSLIEKYINVDSLALAKYWLDYLDEHSELMETDQNKWYYNSARKKYLYALGNYQEALVLGKQTLANNKSQVQAEDISNSEKFLSEVYGKLGMHDLEAVHLKNYITLNDSINSVKNLNALSYYQTLYETAQKDNTIAAQESKLTLIEKESRIKSQWFILVVLSLLSIFAIILLLRSKTHAKRSKLQQENFSKNLLIAQETERTRVAKELHDGVGQKLSLIRRKAENTAQSELALMTADTLEEVRHISRNLYPPMLQKLGLTKSIQHLLLEIDEETDLFVSSEIAPIDHFFTAEETLSFYRFIQESISNVLKHAEAKTISVHISEKNNRLTAIIKDNGNGFDTSKKIIQNSLGLTTMSERIKLLKGNFSIHSSQKRGTEIQAIIKK